MKIGNHSGTSKNGQQLICLLHVLHELGGVRTAQEVCEFIHRRGYLLLSPEDRLPYWSQTEPKWRTDIRYRRKDGVQAGLINGDEHNEWEINRAGIIALEAIAHGTSVGAFSVGDCQLWSDELKRLYAPGWCLAQVGNNRPREPRRINDSTYVLRAIHRLFALGQGELLAARLSTKLDRSVLPEVRDCSSAYAEFRESERDRTLAMALELFG